MHPAVREPVSYELTRAFQEVQARRDVPVGPELGLFVTGIVIESLEFRRNEWEKNANLDPDNPNDASKIAAHASRVVQFLIGESETYALSGGQKRTLLISFLELAHKKWCGIFPFCR